MGWSQAPNSTMTCDSMLSLDACPRPHRLPSTLSIELARGRARFGKWSGRGHKGEDLLPRAPRLPGSIDALRGLPPALVINSGARDVTCLTVGSVTYERPPRRGSSPSAAGMSEKPSAAAAVRSVSSLTAKLAQPGSASRAAIALESWTAS
jgi:hypothetical protein